MSTIRESILSAIADGATSTAAIADATGLELAQVGSNLCHLKRTGEVVGYNSELSLGAGKPPPETKARVHLIQDDDEPERISTVRDERTVALTVTHGELDREAALIESGFTSKRRQQQAAMVNGKEHKLPDVPGAAPIMPPVAETLDVAPRSADKPLAVADPLIVANLGEYVVLRRADLVELLRAVEVIGRWRDVVEAG